LRFKKLGVVARGGIEPPTRGFSVRRRARVCASKPKTGKGLLPGRPSRPARPNPYRTGRLKSCRTCPGVDPAQRLTGASTELSPNRGPSRAWRGLRPAMRRGVASRIDLDLARDLLILDEDPQRAGGGTACPNKRSHLCPRWLTVKLRRAHQISTHRLSAAQSGQSARRNPIAQRCTHAATAARCSGSH